MLLCGGVLGVGPALHVHLPCMYVLSQQLQEAAARAPHVSLLFTAAL